MLSYCNDCEYGKVRPRKRSVNLRRNIYMSVQVEKLEKNMAKLTIEVSAEEFEKGIQAAYLKEKGKISLPGFRKGKHRVR